MYLTMLEGSMGCVIGQHDDTGRKEHAIYYLSKKFTNCESRYSLPREDLLCSYVGKTTFEAVYVNTFYALDI